jgi:dCTP deaminase
VDPGYNGRLVFSVFNAGAADVKLHRDERAFLIWFASLDAKSTRPKRKPGFKSIPSTLLHGLSEESLSLSVLNARLTEAESKINRINWAASILLAALTLSLGLWKIFHEPDHVGNSSESSISQASPKPSPPVMLDYVWERKAQSDGAKN